MAKSYQKKPKDSNPAEPDGQGRKKQSRSGISRLRGKILSPKSVLEQEGKKKFQVFYRFSKEEEVGGLGGASGGRVKKKKKMRKSKTRG
ncbi:hypothetical protein SLEP1_g17543 [Rubroshorea leprosula]|uniref:Uncharacterized protein n=1 Tax=Rubroshorea leprosula TaxID=152421 RepID=A0AAV5J6C9_9ROSI|nr:hypothetical protein SLEP1_g17543 [Rubroshorea leprosula]